MPRPRFLKEIAMNTIEQIAHTLGRMEGELRALRIETRKQLAEIRRLAERVGVLERWRDWVKVIGTALVGAHTYLCRQAHRLSNLF
jgi:hypothetical protein